MRSAPIEACPLGPQYPVIAPDSHLSGNTPLGLPARVARYTTGAMATGYPKLSPRQWATIRPLFKPKPPGPGAPRCDPVGVFRGVLDCLWARRPIRDGFGRIASSATLSTQLWAWSGTGELKAVWRAYLRLLSKRQRNEWQKLFAWYRKTHNDRKLAPRYAGRVHSRWFDVMEEVLAREVRRDRRS